MTASPQQKLGDTEQEHRLTGSVTRRPLQGKTASSECVTAGLGQTEETTHEPFIKGEGTGSARIAVWCYLKMD